MPLCWTECKRPLKFNIFINLLNGQDTIIKINKADTKYLSTTPPSSLWAFLDDLNFSGIVLTDHNGPFINKYYQSQWDVEINLDQITDLSTWLARLIYMYAADLSDPPEDLKADKYLVVCVIAYLQEDLNECFTKGLGCNLGKEFIKNVDSFFFVLNYNQNLRTLSTMREDTKFIKQTKSKGIRDSLDAFSQMPRMISKTLAIAQSIQIATISGFVFGHLNRELFVGN